MVRRLANEFSATRLSPDEWMADLGVDLFDEEFRDRLEQLFWHLAQTLLQRGQDVILESGFWLRSDRDQKRLGAHALGVGVELHYLDVPIDELCRRLEARNVEGPWGAVPITGAQLERWATFFETPDQAEIDLFDDPLLRVPEF
jgi:predicted kinase